MPLQPNPFEQQAPTEANERTASSYFARPKFRVSLVDIRTGQGIEAQFIPEEFEEGVDPSYNRLQIPGMSHQPQQFSSTGNATFTIDLYFNAYSTPEDLARLEEARRFLFAACYPHAGETVVEGAPSRLLFVWPGMVALSVILTGLRIRHTRFNREGKSVQFVASLSLEEIRDARLLPEDILDFGMSRGSPGNTRMGW